MPAPKPALLTPAALREVLSVVQTGTFQFGETDLLGSEHP